MTTPFDALDRAASYAVVTAYAEQAVLRPRTSEQYVERGPDADRNGAIVWGVFSARPTSFDLHGQARGSELDGTTRVNAARSEFWIAREQADALPFRPAKGDLLSLPGRPGSPTYAISAIQPSNMGDMGFLLVREDRPE
ncbi:MAG: hypothetical protein KDK07_02215 [Bauldia sp.]|nr:hypothetical protein [Bauldia sp.]